MKALTSAGSPMILLSIRLRILLARCMVLMFGQRNGLNLKRQCWDTSEFPFGTRAPNMSLFFNSDEAVQLGKNMFPLFALALDLPEDFFANKVPVIIPLLERSL